MTKRFMLSVLALVITAAPAMAQKQRDAVIHEATITRVIDGDTVAFAAPWLLDPLKKELSIRVYGVDTPEKGFRAQCEKEKALGEAATKFTKDAVAKATKKQISLIDWDKYGGRVLGDVILDGKSLRFMLIEKGYAREYYGEAKTSWCK